VVGVQLEFVHRDAHVQKPGVALCWPDPKRRVPHPQPRVPAQLAISFGTAPVLLEKHPQPHLGVPKIDIGVQGTQQRVVGDALIETMHEATECLGAADLVVETLVSRLRHTPHSRNYTGARRQEGLTAVATTRTATTHWEGALLAGGKGNVSLDSSGLGNFDVNWTARAEDANGQTSPEEFIAAAHSSCFSMALSNALAKAGHTDITLDTKADVTFQPGEGITGSHLTVRGAVPGVTAEEFAEFADGASKNCPVSKALAGTTITVEASLA
jgi:osmotically inducible protein OsmC